jgi:hypothetical protein
MLWAGADLYKPGTDDPDEVEEEPPEGLTALCFAALDHRFEVFKLKPIYSRPIPPGARDFITFLTGKDGLDVLRQLLEKGLDPNDQSNGGCTAIQSCLQNMSWDQRYALDPWELDSNPRNMDTDESRERLKAIHILAKHGGKRVPDGKYEMNTVRRALLRLKADYTVEFVWIMCKYKSGSRESLEALLGTPTMKSHIAPHRARIQDLLSTWQTASESPQREHAKCDSQTLSPVK